MLRALALLAVLAAALTLVGCGGAGGLGGDLPITVVDEGSRDPAPDLTVPDLGGGPDVTLAGRDRPVVLNFWASWCEPCTREMPALVEFSERNPDVDVVGVAVTDRPEDSRRFARKVGIPFTLGSDRGGEVAARFGVQGLPVTVLIDAEGRVAATHPGEIDGEELDGYAELLAP